MSHEWIRHERVCSSNTCSHVWMSHVQRINESYPTYEWVMSHDWIRHEWVCSWSTCSHLWMSHVTHVNDSCPTYEWVISHMWISHVWVMSHVQTSHVPHTNDRLPKMQVWDLCHDAFMCVPWLIHTCAMTHSYLCPDGGKKNVYLQHLSTLEYRVAKTRRTPILWL